MYYCFIKIPKWPFDKFETGTQSFEAMAGTTAAVDYLASVGRRFGGEFEVQFPDFEGRHLDLKTAMAAIRSYERGLCHHLVGGLREYTFNVQGSPRWLGRLVFFEVRFERVPGAEPVVIDVETAAAEGGDSDACTLSGTAEHDRADGGANCNCRAGACGSARGSNQRWVYGQC